jgi:N-acetylglucosamine-6-phosphate deacetylase
MSGSSQHAVLASTVFDGTALHHDCAGVIEGPRICDIVARRELPAAMPIRTLPEGAWLAPGFIDVQVNGGGDVLLMTSRRLTALPRSLQPTGSSERRRSYRR